MQNKLLIAVSFIAVIVLIIKILSKEVNIMAVIYAALIIKGKKTIDDVPQLIRDKVREVLIDLDVPELAQ